MSVDLVRRLMAACDHHQWDVALRRTPADRGRLALQHHQVIGHGVKALRLTPVLLHDGVQFRRQLANFADETYERAADSRPEGVRDAA
jgi:hypothetical protein